LSIFNIYKKIDKKNPRFLFIIILIMSDIFDNFDKEDTTKLIGGFMLLCSPYWIRIPVGVYLCYSVLNKNKNKNKDNSQK